MPRRMSEFTAAMALDPMLLARFVDRWRNGGQRPLGLSWLAWNLGSRPVGEARIAVLMKAAEQQRLVVRASARGDQASWMPTAAALEMFPPFEPHVVGLASGRYDAAPDEEARRWGVPGEDEVPMLVRREMREITDRHAPFRGYLPEATE